MISSRWTAGAARRFEAEGPAQFPKLAARARAEGWAASRRFLTTAARVQTTRRVCRAESSRAAAARQWASRAASPVAGRDRRILPQAPGGTF